MANGAAAAFRMGSIVSKLSFFRKISGAGDTSLSACRIMDFANDKSALFEGAPTPEELACLQAEVDEAAERAMLSTSVLGFPIAKGDVGYVLPIMRGEGGYVSQAREGEPTKEEVEFLMVEHLAGLMRDEIADALKGIDLEKGDVNYVPPIMRREVGFESEPFEELYSDAELIAMAEEGGYAHLL